MHALRSLSEDPIIQRHGGKVSRFDVFWMMTPEARRLGVLGWASGVGLSGWSGGSVLCGGVLFWVAGWPVAVGW